MRLVLDLPPKEALFYRKACQKFAGQVPPELRKFVPYWIFSAACHSLAVSDWQYTRDGLAFDARKKTFDEQFAERLVRSYIEGVPPIQE